MPTAARSPRTHEEQGITSSLCREARPFGVTRHAASGDWDTTRSFLIQRAIPQPEEGRGKHLPLRGPLSTQRVFAGRSCSRSFMARGAGEKEAAFSQTHANPHTLVGEKPMPGRPDSRERAKPRPPSSPRSSSLYSLSVHVPGVTGPHPGGTPHPDFPPPSTSGSQPS